MPPKQPKKKQQQNKQAKAKRAFKVVKYQLAESVNRTEDTIALQASIVAAPNKVRKLELLERHKEKARAASKTF